MVVLRFEHHRYRGRSLEQGGQSEYVYMRCLELFECERIRAANSIFRPPGLFQQAEIGYGG